MSDIKFHIIGGIKTWYKGCEIHRDDAPDGTPLPAVYNIGSNNNRTTIRAVDGIEYGLIGSEICHYYKNGLPHREDGPAMNYSDREEWRMNGKLHRIGGPAISDKKEGQQWYFNNVLHNENGPASINPNSGQSYYIQGKLHRSGGFPACIYANGKLEWALYGVIYQIRENGRIKKICDPDKLSSCQWNSSLPWQRTDKQEMEFYNFPDNGEICDIDPVRMRYYYDKVVNMWVMNN